MIKQIKNYTFDASLGKITFTDEANIELENIKPIINVTRGKTLFNGINSDLGGSVSTNILTLELDTSAMGDSDDLSIYYDDGTEPATEEKQDAGNSLLTDIETNQTNGDQKTQLVDENASSINVQNPVPTNGDSIYTKDIDVTGSSVGTFTGDITDLVDDLSTTFNSTGHSSPASFTMKLNRPITNDSLKFCSPAGKNFSNVKITLKDASGTVVRTIDDSANNTKHTSFSYYWRLVTWCTIVVEFYTTDDIDINWIVLEKSVHVHTPAKFRSLANSTSTPLAGDATFTGDWIETKDYVGALIIINTDQDSANVGLQLEFSNDEGNTIIHTHVDKIYANSPNGHHYPTSIDTDYFRVKYTNGSSAQSTFYLSTTLFPNMPEEAHAHGIEYDLDADHPAPVRRVVIVGKNPASDYVNVQTTASGNLKSSLEELESGISTNSNSQLKVTNYKSDGTEMLINGGGEVVILDHAQHSIHDGSHYIVTDIDEDIDIAGPKYWHIKAPNTSARIHVNYNYHCTKNAKFEVFENPTLSNDGTSLSIINNERNSLNTSTALVYYDPTVSVDGTRIDVESVGDDSTNPTGIAGEHKREDDEIVLKQNTSYLFKITALTDNMRASIRLNLIEE